MPAAAATLPSREGCSMPMRVSLRPPVLLVLAAIALASCSIKRTAVDIVGDALSGGGEVFSSDEDPDLVREAVPFGLKTYESLLAVSPDHKGLLLSAASGFVGYAYILQQEADLMGSDELARAREQRLRASKLFWRGEEYALRGLEVAHPGFRAELKQDATIALAKTEKRDVPFLYWAGAGLAGALSANKGDPQLIADLPLAGALVAHVLVLDESYDAGAAHEFFIAYEGARPGGSVEEARQHYRRALELSEGNRASVYLALAETVSVREQNLEEFRRLIQAALGVDPNRVPRWRVVNTLAMRRAQFLQDHVPDFFASADITG
jgi:predicted anti-sigma-YlaC factor YlaD